MTLYIAALILELHLPQCHSLKEKRAIIKPILQKAQHRYKMSLTEVDYQELWQRALLASTTVSSSAKQVEEVFNSLERFVWSNPEIEVVSVERKWFSEEIGS